MSTSLLGDGDCVEWHPGTLVITTALLRGCCIGQSCRAAPCTFWVLLPKARHRKHTVDMRGGKSRGVGVGAPQK